MWIGAAAVTVLFYFILEYFHTANIVPSTLSVTTSFVAVYLTFRRSPLFALAYASNDIVLIVLWILASIYDIRYVSVAVCFVTFLVNDIYGYISWQKMKRRQGADLSSAPATFLFQKMCYNGKKKPRRMKIGNKRKGHIL